jgi:predicted RNA-binding Zn ribbon-like protein
MAAEFTDPSAAAERAAALTGLLTGGQPAGADEVAAVLRDFGEPEPIAITRADLAALRRVAARLREVFAAPDADTAARLLNHLLAASAGPPRLSSHDGTTPWHVHVDRADDAPWADWFAAASAAGLATLLAARQAVPGGLCAAPGCGAPFAATGGGSPRRYCSARCASRVRVTAYRERSQTTRTST